MSRFLGYAKTAVAVLAVLPSPAILMLGTPLAIGIASDIAAHAGAGLCAAAIEVATAMLIAHRLLRAAPPYAAAKSIS